MNQQIFDEQLAAGELAIALIGMSSVGKSHRAHELQTKLGWQRTTIDDEIARCISDLLPVADVEGLASWMQQPDSDGYADREAQYLQLEEAETAHATPADLGNYVLDTTGSSIYLSSQTLDELRQRYLVIHLAATPAQIDKMTERFFQHPKPIVWGSKFNKKADESTTDALRRCYPELLKWRYAKYEELADITIPSWNGKHEKRTPNEFLNMIRDKLPA